MTALKNVEYDSSLVAVVYSTRDKQVFPLQQLCRNSIRDYSGGSADRVAWLKAKTYKGI
jgi:hypothetical protein